MRYFLRDSLWPCLWSWKSWNGRCHLGARCGGDAGRDILRKGAVVVALNMGSQCRLVLSSRRNVGVIIAIILCNFFSGAFVRMFRTLMHFAISTRHPRPWNVARGRRRRRWWALPERCGCWIHKGSCRGMTPSPLFESTIERGVCPLLNASLGNVAEG